MRVCAELMVEIERYVRRKALSRAEAAKKLGVTRLRFNDLLHGKIDKFSLDTLVNMLGRIGKQISVCVRKAT